MHTNAKLLAIISTLSRALSQNEVGNMRLSIPPVSSDLAAALDYPLSLRRSVGPLTDTFNTYIRISVLALILLCIALLGFLVFQAAGRWLSPNAGDEKRKLRYMLISSFSQRMRGRNKTCISENGCSGGTMNRCNDETCHIHK